MLNVLRLKMDHHHRQRLETQNAGTRNRGFEPHWVRFFIFFFFFFGCTELLPSIIFRYIECPTLKMYRHLRQLFEPNPKRHVFPVVWEISVDFNETPNGDIELQRPQQNKVLHGLEVGNGLAMGLKTRHVLNPWYVFSFSFFLFLFS